MFSKFLLLLFFNIYVCFASFQPIFSNTEICINENDPLELFCTNGFIVYPKNSTNKIPSSPAEIQSIDIKNGLITYLTRNKTISGDAGWYGCVDTADKNHILQKLHHIYMSPYNYNESDVQWMYVYVNSSDNFSPEGHVRDYDVFRVASGETVIFPYRSTLPTFNVTLFKDDERVKLNDRITYDPKKGFTLQNASIEDSGSYWCSTDNLYRIDFDVAVSDRIKSMKPLIDDNKINYDVNQKKLEMVCSIDVDKDIAFALDWKVPKMSNRVLTNSTYVWRGFDYGIHNTLIINNFTSEDQGVYECRLYKDFQVFTRSIYVELIANGTVIFEVPDFRQVDVKDISNVSKNVTNSGKFNDGKHKIEIFSNNTGGSKDLLNKEVKEYIKKSIHKEVQEYLKKNVYPQIEWLKSVRSTVKNFFTLLIE